MTPRPERSAPGSVQVEPVPGLREVRPSVRSEEAVSVASAADADRMPDLAAVVPVAAAILDEEMAAGMQAARDARRSGSPSSQGVPMPRSDERPLHDLHELVDALGEALPRIRSYFDEAAMRSAATGGGLDGESVPVLRPPTPVRPGQCAGLSMRLDNDDTRLAQVALRCTDLFSTSGVRIAQRCVTVTPDRLQLGPDAHAVVALKIAVPHGIAPGEYSGLLLAAGLAYFRAVVAIEVSWQ